MVGILTVSTCVEAPLRLCERPQAPHGLESKRLFQDATRESLESSMEEEFQAPQLMILAFLAQNLPKGPLCH